MDFDLNRAQQARLATLGDLVARLGGPPPADGLPGEHRRALAVAVGDDASLTGDDLHPLDRVLLVEEAARLGAPIHAAAILLVAPLAGVDRPAGPIAVTMDASSDPVRYGAIADTVVDVSSSGVRTSTLTAAERAAVVSGFGSTYGVVAPSHRSPVAWLGPTSPALLYHLGLAAEIAGAARAALDHTSRFLTERQAFGRTLSTFQALRHRLSELAVDAAATSSLVHLAAWRLDDAAIHSAIAYATATAAAIPPELHQMSGARGFTVEFGLSRWTMLLEALRIELGGVFETAADHAVARWS